MVGGYSENMKPSRFFLLFYTIEISVQQASIPEHLYECYDRKVDLLPMSMQSFIDIVRKIEGSEYFYMDMRMLANSIIKRFWRDGIEKDTNAISHDPSIIYFMPSGFQSHKFQLLQSYLIPTGGSEFPNDTISLEERCTLHFMLSSSIDVWERGDEDFTCPDLRSYQKQWTNHEWLGVKKSTCPIEKGVVLTPGGTVSPSHIITAVASALQPMDVNQEILIPKKYKFQKNLKSYETISNIWASTICGDLAEVIVFQKPLSDRIYIGVDGMWNNTDVPARYYLKTDYNTVLNGFWQFTDAELLGGIDGLILSNDAVLYSNFTFSLRLSQLLEMYYKNRGGNFPIGSRLCDRRGYFNTLLPKKGIILQQTLKFAQVLAFYSPHYFTDNKFLEEHLEEAYDKFINYASNLITNLNRPCPNRELTNGKINLFVLYDSTWNSYETLEVVSRISDIIDVSYHFGSRISVINGVKGDTIVNFAQSKGEVYLSWMKASQDKKNTDSSHIHRGFITLKSLLENPQTSDDPFALVTVVLTPSTSISDHSYDAIISTLKSIKSANPDMKFIYVTSTMNSRAVVKMTALPGSQDDHIITLDEKNKNDLYKELEILQDVPRNIIPPLCTLAAHGHVNFSIEQYISPDTVQNYRIHPKYLCSSKNLVEIKVRNYNYGDVEVCLKRDEKNMTCYLSSNRENVIHQVLSPCPSMSAKMMNEQWDVGCKPVFLLTRVKRSLRKCTERDCRYPDDIRFSIEISGLKCLQYPICSSSISLKSTFIFVIFCINFLF